MMPAAPQLACRVAQDGGAEGEAADPAAAGVQALLAGIAPPCRDGSWLVRQMEQDVRILPTNVDR
jgi:hypothetical protein